jgi:NAD(P)-dependent dehydrogenase (short-subunit alcohol dehydrogenase family)
MPTLQYKTALVTGASRGIGRATALALASAGAHVLVHYARSKPEAESLVAEINAKGGRADAVSADLGTPDGASLLAKQVRSIVGDRLDVLVLNAGVSKSARIADYTVEDFDSLFATNVRGPFFLVQQLCRPSVRAQALLLSLLSEPARWWATRVTKPLRFLPTPLLKERLRLWSRTGPLFSGRAAYV